MCVCDQAKNVAIGLNGIKKERSQSSFVAGDWRHCIYAAFRFIRFGFFFVHCFDKLVNCMLKA